MGVDLIFPQHRTTYHHHPIVDILFFEQVHPNADRSPHLRGKMYEFAGRVVGKCLYESALGGAYKQLVRARFTRSFLAQIIGLRMNYKVRKCFESNSANKRAL